MTAHKDMMSLIIGKKELATETGLQARKSKSNTLDSFKESGRCWWGESWQGMEEGGNRPVLQGLNHECKLAHCKA